MAVDIPECVGRYRVEAVIGTGGFATVYRAIDERLDAAVAVKVLAENHSHDPDIRERFLKEGRALRRIDSAHVVRVHDMGETERGQPYLVLDYADGGNLADRVTGRRVHGWRPTVGDVLQVADGLATGLESAHASGLVHRDVAPRNLLIRSSRLSAWAARPDAVGPLLAAEERLMLADLGLSKDLATASGLTAGGGTAGFVPPEQRGGPTQVDAQADIWAASAVMVWLIAGAPPDDDEHWRGAMANGGWPRALIVVLAQGMARESGSRQAGVRAWLAAVRGALAPPPAVEQPGALRSASWRWRVAAAAACALIGFGVAWLLYGRETGSAISRQTEQQLPDGQVKVEGTSGGRSVAIVGPDKLTVGEEVTYQAELDDVVEVIWVGPDGQIHNDDTPLSVTADSPGSVTITLIGIDESGRTVVARHIARAD